MLSDIEHLEQAKETALKFVTGTSQYIEIRGQDSETVAIGYWDGRRFHWFVKKSQIENAKTCSWIVKRPLWWGPEGDPNKKK